MKKLIFFLLALMIAFASCKKDKDEDDEEKGLNPTQTQWGFTLEYTRTNCGICGSTGGPVIHSLHDMGNVVALAVHVNGSNDSMVYANYSGFSGDRPSGGGIPSFWVGNVKATTGDATTHMTTLLGESAIAGVDLSYTISGGKMKVKTKTKFFSAGTGDYLLSVYLLQDGVDGGTNAPPGFKQSGGAPDYIHDFILRDASTGNVYGETLATSPASGDTFEKEYEFSLGYGWVASNCYAVAVIWQYDPSASPAHVYINSKEVK
ncbi:MAG: Omp28-related outer membrane protein [Saprospiraceae bacterium]|nr:Omp28-related outer membrane protein [Saprospiraceae bacterium]